MTKLPYMIKLPEGFGPAPQIQPPPQDLPKESKPTSSKRGPKRKPEELKKLQFGMQMRAEPIAKLKILALSQNLSHGDMVAYLVDKEFNQRGLLLPAGGAE
jgi:hypothetical protein